MVRFQNFVSKVITATLIDVLCSNFMKFGQRKICEIVHCLPDKKILLGCPAVAAVQIVPTICQGQPSTMYSERDRFHLNRFTFGRVIAESVKTAITHLKVNPIFDWSLPSSRIVTLLSCLQSALKQLLTQNNMSNPKLRLLYISWRPRQLDIFWLLRRLDISSWRPGHLDISWRPRQLDISSWRPGHLDISSLRPRHLEISSWRLRHLDISWQLRQLNISSWRPRQLDVSSCDVTYNIWSSCICVLHTDGVADDLNTDESAVISLSRSVYIWIDHWVVLWWSECRMAVKMVVTMTRTVRLLLQRLLLAIWRYVGTRRLVVLGWQQQLLAPAQTQWKHLMVHVMTFCTSRTHFAVCCYFYALTIRPRQRRHHVFALSICHVHSLIWTHLVTTISRERLEQFWWNWQGIFTSPCWWPH